MKRKIVISINPEHVENILNGSKKFEYRTRAAKKDINSILIYETTPMKKVVAEVEILDVLEMSPKQLWEETSDYSGINKEYFDTYFRNRKVAYAYKLGKVIRFDIPKELSEFGLKYAPQSYVYVG